MQHKITQYPVPLVFRQILKNRFNGRFTIHTDTFEKELFFIDSHLVSARTTVQEERLGELLCHTGKLSRDQLVRVLNRKDKEQQDDKIGKIMVQENVLNQRDLYLGLLLQLKTIARSTFSVNSGEWILEGKATNMEADRLFDVKLPMIIADGIDQINDFVYFKDKLGPGKLKTLPIPRHIKEILSSEDNWLYARLAALEDEIIAHIVERLDLPEFFFWKKMIFFYLLNIIDFEPEPVESPADRRKAAADRATNETAAELRNLYKHIRERTATYYDILGLEKNAPPEKVKQAYLEMARRFHPDRIPNMNGNNLKEKANFVLAEMNKAFEVLTDERQRRQYDSNFQRPDDESVNGNGKSKREHAATLYRRAKRYYTEGKFNEAVDCMEEAVDIDPRTSKYLHLLGVCQMKLPDGKNAAALSLLRAHEMDKMNPNPLVALGLLFYSENMMTRAKTYFQKALEVDPQNAAAKKKLLEITGRKPKGSKKFSLTSIFGLKKTPSH